MDWRYAAGFFDGEGSIGLRMDARSKTGSVIPYICITQAEKYRGFRAITELAKFLEQEGIPTYVYIVDQRGKATINCTRNYRTMRFFIASYPNVLYVLRKLLPYLIVRKNSAEDLIRFMQLFPPRTGKNANRYRPKRPQYLAELAKSD